MLPFSLHLKCPVFTLFFRIWKSIHCTLQQIIQRAQKGHIVSKTHGQLFIWSIRFYSILLWIFMHSYIVSFSLVWFWILALYQISAAWGKTWGETYVSSLVIKQHAEWNILTVSHFDHPLTTETYSVAGSIHAWLLCLSQRTEKKNRENAWICEEKIRETCLFSHSPYQQDFTTAGNSETALK